MTGANPIRVLLGPQSPAPNIADAVANAGLPDGPLAVISAAWQEAEGDLGELGELLARPLEDLHLYKRVEDLMAGDPALEAAARLRQDRLVEQQRLYRLRLKQLSVAARHMLNAKGDADAIAAEQRHAVAQLRALDRHHLDRSESIWQTFVAAYNPDSYPALAAQVRELGDIVQRCAGVVITGGNVAVLINRMRLLGLDKLLESRNIVAWSAGAMALTERIVLFHERSPEGRRDAEVLGAGCAVIPDYVVLPNAKGRLRTGYRQRMGLLCRRFSPAACVTLDNGASLTLDASGVKSADEARRLDRGGRLVRLRPE
ncbi:MAG: hypothetical protein AAFX56_09480 [Pseudomonadota bacterium]